MPKLSMRMEAKDSRMRSVAEPAAACARCAAVLALLRKRDASSCGHTAKVLGVPTITVNDWDGRLELLPMLCCSTTPCSLA